MAQRPKTQREIESTLRKRTNDKMIVIENICKQKVNIQLAPPIGKDGKPVDALIGQQSIPLYTKQTALFPKSRLDFDQITNLQKKGMVRIKSHI